MIPIMLFFNLLFLWKHLSVVFSWYLVAGDVLDSETFEAMLKSPIFIRIQDS